MKNILKGIFAIASIALIGCTEDEQFIAMNDTNETYTGVMEILESRTSLGENGKVVWSNNDAISIFKRSGYHQKYQVVAGGSDIATFNYANASTNHGVSLTKNYAVYPYSSNHSITSNEKITLDLSTLATQNYTEGSFENGKSAMVAKSTNQELAFYNTLAMLRVKLCSEVPGDYSINSITLTSATKTLSGTATVDMSQDKQPAVFTSGNKTITLNCTQSVKLVNTCDGTTGGHDFYILVPVGNYPANDLTIKVTGVNNNDNSSIVYETSYPEVLNLERSGITTIHHKFEEGDWKAYIEPVVVNNATDAQTALDQATDGTVIKLAPNINYGVLKIQPVVGNANTTTGTDYTIWGNERLRKVENLTIVGAPGATVDAIEVVSGHIEGSIASIVDIKNLVIDGVEFNADYNNSSNHPYKSPIFINLSYINVDGLTVKNCKLDGDNDKMNFVYVYGSQQTNASFTTAAKNITITGNTINGIARLCELRGTENVTITNNTIKNTYLHAILLAKDDKGENYSGNVSITDNTADGINERFVRMAGAGDANVVIKNNVITNHKGTDADWIKVTNATGTVTIEKNTFTVSTAEVLQAAIKYGNNTVVLANDINVDEWIMFSETLSIGSGNIITVKMNGLTIDGNGHTLTINSIESAGNGNRLFYDASNLNINDITIKYADGVAGGIGLQSGIISNVNFEGGYGILPQNGVIKVENCTFATNATALYFEEERDNLTVTGCTFNQPDDTNVILLRGNVKFTNNIINSGRTVNIVSGSPVVTGNNFNNVRLKVYQAATATISKNTINNLVFETDSYASTFADDNILSTDAQNALNAATKSN